MADEMLENYLRIDDPGCFADQNLKESEDLLTEVSLEATTRNEISEKNKCIF